MHDETRILNDRHRAIQGDLDRLATNGAGGSRSLLCVTTTVTTYPGVANAFYAVLEQDIDGTEEEGASATFTTGTDVFYAWNAGTQIPPNGTQVICKNVGSGKWVFAWNG